MTERCKQMVTGATSFHRYRCSRYARKDGYCNQHHPDTVKKRRKKSDEAYEFREKQRGGWAAFSYIAAATNKELTEISKAVYKRSCILNPTKSDKL